MPRTTESISVKGLTYEAVKKHCLARGLAIGPEVSKWIEEHLDGKEAQARLRAEQSPPEPPKPRRSERSLNAEIRKHFTF